MKKLILIITATLMTSGAMAEEFCPCPGPCCPLFKNEYLNVANVLYPWVDESGNVRQII